jgi:hypothetical protein
VKDWPAWNNKPKQKRVVGQNDLTTERLIFLDESRGIVSEEFLS